MNTKKWVSVRKRSGAIYIWHLFIAQEEKQERKEAHTKLIDEIRERNRQREHEATFTEIWYTFVDPYATDVDERGTGKYRLFLFTLNKIFLIARIVVNIKHKR